MMIKQTKTKIEKNGTGSCKKKIIQCIYTYNIYIACGEYK